MEYKQDELPVVNKYLTEEEVRALIATSMLNQTDPQRVQSGYIQSGNYADGNGNGWKLTSEEAFLPNITLSGGTIKYLKTGFTDSTHAGYYMGSDGIYFGSAADASKLQYNISTGAFDFIGTVSGRSTLTLSTSINASGNLVTDIINLKLDTSAKKILSDFTFGSTDYSGALKTGDIAWNDSTGAITGGSGGLFNKNGLVFAHNGVPTITLDGITGSATFAGSITASTIDIGGADVTSFHVDVNGNIWSGAATYDPTTNPFAVSNTGSLYANNAIVNGSSISNDIIFGDTSDGDATISANTALYRDMYYNNLVINSGVTLNPAGYRIFARTITNNGTISVIGGSGGNGGSTGFQGAQGTAGTAGTIPWYVPAQGSSLPSGALGALGGSGAAGVSGTVSKALTGAGAIGGRGGSFYSGQYQTGYAGGGVGTNTTIFNTVRNLSAAYLLYDFYPTPLPITVSGGSGSGGAGAYFSNYPGGGGGGSGASGGLIYLCAKKIINNGIIDVHGGDGGNGGDGYHNADFYAGNGGGGGGGNGGDIIFIFSSYINNGTLIRTGGKGGTGGTPGVYSGEPGADGIAGYAGYLMT